MSIPLHLWIKDDNGADIRGSSQVVGREGSIEVLSFTHGLSTPADPTTGQLLGIRQHRPVVIEKEIDRTSPLLYMALVRGKTLQSAEIKWYRVNEAGREEEYFNVVMRSVKVVSASPRVLNIKDSASERHNHLEQVEFRYEDITWNYVDGNLIFRDAWSTRYLREA